MRGDITDLEALRRTLDEHRVTRVVHLAALQVPFCRADPVLGARVNVVGTVNVFEAVKERLDRIPGVAYASSAAIYGQGDPSPAPESGGTAPATFYGVTKQANEGTARLYWAENAVPSVGIRPYVVYGPGRDQGMTSGPTLAMAAAARGESFAIGYGGSAQYDYAPAVGRGLRHRQRGACGSVGSELSGRARVDGRSRRRDRGRSAGDRGPDHVRRSAAALSGGARGACARGGDRPVARSRPLPRAIGETIALFRGSTA